MSSSRIQMTQCTACLEHKRPVDFPARPLTMNCTHDPSLCLGCITLYINSQIQGTAVDQTRCPECEEQLDFDTIRLFASPDLFNRSHRLAIDSLLSKTPLFVWCPLGCGDGQIHRPGTSQPLVFCPRCNRQFCFRHRIAWHSDYTCEEYDAFLANPRGFRSRAQIRRAADRNAYREIRQQLKDAEARIAESLLREGQAAEARRIAKKQRREEQRRQMAERARREEEERRAQEALERRARIQKEEMDTDRVSMPCPRCGVRIVKIYGCNHMRCRRCLARFIWDRRYSLQ